jgi:hypothetical protein
MGDTAFVDDERDRRRARRTVKEFIVAAHAAIPMASPDERLDRRRETAPNRDEVPRVELPVEIAAAVVEAEAAGRAGRDFRFDQATAAVESTPPREVEDEGEFHFFQGD